MSWKEAAGPFFAVTKTTGTGKRRFQGRADRMRDREEREMRGSGNRGGIGGTEGRRDLEREDQVGKNKREKARMAETYMQKEILRPRDRKTEWLQKQRGRYERNTHRAGLRGSVWNEGGQRRTEHHY